MIIALLASLVVHAGMLMGPAQPVAASPPTSVVQDLQAEAELLKPLVSSRLAGGFLAATSRLPDPGVRTVMRNKDKGVTLTVDSYEKLPEEQRAGFAKRELQPRFYYYTGYGTPLMYARALDLLGRAEEARWGTDVLTGRRILDFGCGTIGHLRLLASMGADVTGVDVEPMFDALYSAPGDQGAVQGEGESKGAVRVLTGRWPAEQPIVHAVTSGGAYDLFMSKNTLKRGYIHPAREVDPSRLVNLGVDDAAFLRAVHGVLKPDGLFLIYNMSPAQAAPGQPYLPHADGECPFTREQLENAGFEVVKFDEKDQDGIVPFWTALGYNEGKDAEAVRRELFAWWTLCRKRAAGTGSENR